MKIRLLWISIVLLTVAMITTMFINSNDRKIISNEYSNKSFVNTNSLTMMYETDINSGEYQISDDISWPQDDIFLMKIYQNVKMVEYCLGIMILKE